MIKRGPESSIAGHIENVYEFSGPHFTSMVLYIDYGDLRITNVIVFEQNRPCVLSFRLSMPPD